MLPFILYFVGSGITIGILDISVFVDEEFLIALIWPVYWIVTISYALTILVFKYYKKLKEEYEKKRND